jgi:hypothetical protein
MLVLNDSLLQLHGPRAEKGEADDDSGTLFWLVGIDRFQPPEAR